MSEFESDYLEVEVSCLVSDEGSVVVFAGWFPSYEECVVNRTPGSAYLQFSCDHRCAQDIIDALNDIPNGGETPVAFVPHWSILLALCS